MQAPTKSASRWAHIQLLRFIAAAAVALFHVRDFYLQAGGFEAVYVVMRKGWLGVYVFFAISGFVIFLSSKRTPSVAQFLWRRFLRIYPSLWAALAIWLVVAWWGGFEMHPEQIFHSATLIDPNPSAATHVLPVTWTLSFEMLFYCALALAILLPARARWLVLLAVPIMLELARHFLLATPPIFISPVIYAFILGVCAAAAYPSLELAFVSLAICIGGFVVAIWLQADLNKFWPPVVFGGLTAAYLFGMQRWDFVGPVARVVEYLGAISFALYLIHPSVMGVMLITGVHWSAAAAIGPELVTVLYLAASVGLAAVFHELVERRIVPMLFGGRRRDFG